MIWCNRPTRSDLYVMHCRVFIGRVSQEFCSESISSYDLLVVGRMPDWCIENPQGRAAIRVLTKGCIFYIETILGILDCFSVSL